MKCGLACCGIATLWFVGACVDSSAAPAAASTGARVAGGDTSEFSGGDIAVCPEVVSNTPLDLERPELAPWLALAAGRHEVSFGWRRPLPTDASDEPTEHTTLWLDVSVLSARDVIYGAGSSTDYETSGCAGLRARQLELAIDFETADGALRGSFQHWVEPRLDPSLPGGRALSTAALIPGNGRVVSYEMSSTLEFSVAPEQVASRELWVALAFDAEAVRGSFVLWYTWLQPTARGDWTWAAFESAFPDDGCSPARPIALDETVSELGDTPRAVYERAAAAAQNAPIPALWGIMDLSIPPSQRMQEMTQVSLHAGAPTRACQANGQISLNAPLSVETADGRLKLTQALQLLLRDDGNVSGYAGSPLIAAEDFEAMTGMRGLSLGAQYGGFSMSNGIDYADDALSGQVELYKVENLESPSLQLPGLRWCAGAGCAFLWCWLTSEHVETCD